MLGSYIHSCFICCDPVTYMVIITSLCEMIPLDACACGDKLKVKRLMNVYLTATTLKIWLAASYSTSFSMNHINGSFEQRSCGKRLPAMTHWHFAQRSTWWRLTYMFFPFSLKWGICLEENAEKPFNKKKLFGQVLVLHGERGTNSSVACRQEEPILGGRWRRSFPVRWRTLRRGSWPMAATELADTLL